MKLRLLALTALAALSFNAHAGLTTYAPWDATYPGIAGVQFNVKTDADTGTSIAMGAHPYTSGVTMPNNGVDTYYANAGLATPLRAKWSFDFAWDFGQCGSCSVKLFVDTDPTTGENLVELPIFGIDSWNMEMNFMDAVLAYNFDPFAASSTAFSLLMLNADNNRMLQSDITVNVNVNVPEPGSMALLGLGLAGMGALLRRRGKR